MNNNIWFRQAIYTGPKFIKWHYWGFTSLNTYANNNKYGRHIASPFIHLNRSIRAGKSYPKIFETQTDVYFEGDYLRDKEGNFFMLKWDGFTMKYYGSAFNTIRQQTVIHYELNEELFEQCQKIGNCVEGVVINI